MENKGQLTKLFEERTYNRLLLFINLFAPGEKHSISQASKRNWYLHKKQQLVLAQGLPYCPTFLSQVPVIFTLHDLKQPYRAKSC